MADTLNGPEQEITQAIAWPQLPTETDIYILPDGRVVIADLPAELASILSGIGGVEACEIAPDAQPDSAL